MSRRPLLGSVPCPVKMPPKSSTAHMTAPRTTAISRPSLVKRPTATVPAATAHETASPTETSVPMWLAGRRTRYPTLAPQPDPTDPRGYWAQPSGHGHRPTGTRGCRRPDEHREEHVEDRRAGRARERISRAREQAAEALANPHTPRAHGIEPAEVPVHPPPPGLLGVCPLRSGSRPPSRHTRQIVAATLPTRGWPRCAGKPETAPFPTPVQQLPIGRPSSSAGHCRRGTAILSPGHAV